MMWRKKWWLFIVTCMCIVAMINTNTVLAQQKVVKVLYGGAALETMQIMEMAVNLWNETQAKSTGIKVELQMVAGEGFWDKFKVMMATKQLPDILRADDDWVGEYFVRGQFMDLTDLVKRDIDVKKFWPDGWKPFMYDGKIYALPFKGDTVALYYNKKLFREAGILEPKGTNFTWDRFLEACKKLTKEKDGRPDTFGFGIRSQWLYPQTWIWRWGGSIFNREKTESTITSKEAIEALQFYTDLRHKYKVAPSASLEQEEGSETLFRAGRVAMWEAGNWAILEYRRIRSAGGLDFGIALPVRGPKNNLTRSTWEGWSIPYYSQNKEEAWKVIKWLSTDPKPQRLLASAGAIPIIRTFAYSELINPKTPEDESIFLRIIEKYSRISEFLLQGAEFDRIWNKNVEGLFIGTKTAKQAAEDFKKEIDELIKREIQFRPYADPDTPTP